MICTVTWLSKSWKWKGNPMVEQQLNLKYELEDLTPEEILVWEEIKGRKREEAVKIRDLAMFLGMDERRMRQTINRLRKMGYLIGSSSESPPGYYQIMTKEDLEETCRMFKQRALDELYVWSRLRKCSLSDLLGQLRLELEKEE